MIEIICGEGEDKGMTTQGTIKRPKNIKQIGEVNSEKKIYIEDYVFTYINSVAYDNPEKVKAGVLLGESHKTLEESLVFIKGAVNITVDDTDNSINFDDKVWTSIYGEMEKYFGKLEIVGWFVSTPNATPEYFSILKKIHIDNFAGNMKTLYLVNTIEKEENFYLYENNKLSKQCGFVCFYERNNEMQEYMLANRGERTIEEPIQEDVVTNIRNVIQEKREAVQQRRTTSMLYVVSTFMIVVVLVIGINLMNSYEKMQNFDNTLNSIVKEISNLNGTQDGLNDEATPVNKIIGNVYPTEAETQTGQAETITSAEPDTKTAESQVSAENNEQGATGSMPVSVKPILTYTVEKGDTLMSICRQNYGNVEKYKEVMELNNIDDADKIYVGQEIKLP